MSLTYLIPTSLFLCLADLNLQIHANLEFSSSCPGGGNTWKCMSLWQCDSDMSSSGSNTAASSYPQPMLAYTILDVLDYIFSFLEGDNRSLKHCSLVCRAWSISTASYLFASVTFNPAYFVPSADDDDLYEPIYAWLAYRPRVCGNVREVIIDNELSPGYTPTRYPYFEDLPLAVIGDILATFPHVRNMRFIRGCTFATEMDSPSSFSLLAHTPPHPLDRLEIELTNDMFALAPLVDIFELFGEVKTVVMTEYKGSMLDQPPVHLVDSSRRCTTDSLVIGPLRDPSSLSDVLATVSYAMDLSNLTALRVEAHFSLDFSIIDVNKFLREHAPNIVQFTFAVERSFGCRLGSGPDDTEQSTAFGSNVHFDLSPCQSLSTVQHDMWFCLGDSDFDDVVAQDSVWQNLHIWVPAVYSLLSAPFGTLVRICLRLFFTACSPATFLGIHALLEQLDWTLLDRVIERHPHLKQLQIQLPSTTPDFEDVLADILHRLSRPVSAVAAISVRPSGAWESMQEDLVE